MSTPYCSVAQQDREQNICVLLEGAPSKKNKTGSHFLPTFNVMVNSEESISHKSNSVLEV